MDGDLQEIETLQCIIDQKTDEIELKNLEICRLEEMMREMATAHNEFFKQARKNGKCPERGFIAPRASNLVAQSSLMYVPVLWPVPFVA